MQKTFGLIDQSELTGTTLIIGDVKDVLKEFPTDSVDLIYSDEAYDDLEIHRNIGTTTRLKHSKSSSNDWYETVKYEDIVPLYAKILKQGKHWYFWRPAIALSSLGNWCMLLDPIKGILAENNLSVRKAIPVPKNNGMGYSWRSSHEYIVFAFKGNKMEQLNDKTLNDYFDDVVWLGRSDKDRIHVSQKPYLAAKKIMLNSSKEGDFLLEPFAGSFTTGIINHYYNMQRNVIGIEKNREIATKTIRYFRDNEIPIKTLDFQTLRIDKILDS